MAYQETTTIGYGTRLKNSFGGIATGFLMFIAGTCLIWWNEGRAVKTDKMLKEAEKVAVHVDNIDKLDASLEGQLIHANGMALTTDTLRDEAFGVKANAIHLQRRVEFYQWVEHAKQESKDKLGGKEEITTTYTYSKQWVSQPVNSSSFKDPAYQNVKNGAVIQAENAEMTAENVTFGAYTLPDFMINSIGGMQAAEVAPTEQQLRAWDQQIKRVQSQFGRVTVTEEMTSKIANEVTAAASDVTAKAIAAINGDTTLTAEQKAIAIDSVRRDSIAMATKTEPAKVGGYTATYVHVGNGKLYFGLNEGAPEVGDVRITFTMTGQHLRQLYSQERQEILCREQRREDNGRDVCQRASGQQHVALALPHHRTLADHQRSEGYLRNPGNDPEGGAVPEQHPLVRYQHHLLGGGLRMGTARGCRGMALLPSADRYRAAGHRRSRDLLLLEERQGQERGCACRSRA